MLLKLVLNTKNFAKARESLLPLQWNFRSLTIPWMSVPAPGTPAKYHQNTLTHTLFLKLSPWHWINCYNYILTRRKLIQHGLVAIPISEANWIGQQLLWVSACGSKGFNGILWCYVPFYQQCYSNYYKRLRCNIPCILLSKTPAVVLFHPWLAGYCFKRRAQNPPPFWRHFRPLSLARVIRRAPQWRH